PAGDRDANPAGGHLVPRDRLPGDEQGTAVPPKGTTRVEEDVHARAVRVGVKAQLGNVGLPRERGLVERLDIVEPDRDVQALEIDAPVHDGVEDEAVVRARRETERQGHSDSTISTAVSPRFRT